MISIIIPTYNDNESLRLCLSSIARSNYKPFEVTVVDDGSIPTAEGIVAEYGFKYLRLEKNCGQAVARNEGARIAQGDVLLFIDSDVAVDRDTIGRVAKAYDSDEINIFQGIPSKKPLNKGFGPELLSLKMYFMLKDCRQASYVHSHIFSIRRGLFDEIGGFDPRFRPPGCGEEFELGHRLRRNHIIHTDPELVVDQKGVSILSRTFTLYHRAYAWASLFSKEKRFENTNASFREAMLGFISVSAVVSLLVSLYFPYSLYVAAACFLFYILVDMKFYRFLFQERGGGFMARSVIPNMLWSISIALGGLHYFVNRFIGRQHENG